MIEAIKEFVTYLKDTILLLLSESGIFPVILYCFIFLIIALFCLPFYLVGLPFYLLNEKSKSWGIKSNDLDSVGKL